MVSSQDKSAIKQLLQSPQWQVAERLANELRDQIAYESKVGGTEWESLRKLLGDDGQIRGIERFIKELYKVATNDNNPPTKLRGSRGSEVELGDE